MVFRKVGFNGIILCLAKTLPALASWKGGGNAVFFPPSETSPSPVQEAGLSAQPNSWQLNWDTRIGIKPGHSDLAPWKIMEGDAARAWQGLGLDQPTWGRALGPLVHQESLCRIKAFWLRVLT